MTLPKGVTQLDVKNALALAKVVDELSALPTSETELYKYGVTPLAYKATVVLIKVANEINNGETSVSVVIETVNREMKKGDTIQIG